MTTYRWRLKLVGRWRGWSGRSLPGGSHPGQMVFTGAVMMAVLLAMTGLAVDVGVWFVARTRLQRAVDAAALSVILDRPTATQANGSDINSPVTGGVRPATDRARTFILNQGIPATELSTVYSAVPRTNRFTVTATQVVPTAFARVIGVNQAAVNAIATADINSYLEIPVSPVCGAAPPGSSVVCDGGVGDSTMDAFGTSRHPTNGDPYTNPNTGVNPYYLDPNGQPYLPEGYLYRVHVEAGYTGALEIQVFDPDTWNQNNPRRCITPSGTRYDANPCNAGDSITAEYSALTNTSTLEVPTIGPNFYGPGYHLFWRVDECFGSTCQPTSDQIALEYTLWYFSPNALDPLNPIGNERQDIERVVYRDAASTSITCQSAGASRPQHLDPGTPCNTMTWTCAPPYGASASCTDLRWMRLFVIPDVAAYPAQQDGSRSFFIYVRSLSPTTTETGYHLRSGPPVGDPDQNSAAACSLSHPVQTKGFPYREHVNGQSYCPWRNGRAGGNTKIFARRAMPTNAMQWGPTGSTPYIIWLGYIPKAASGQTLLMRNFDLDRPGLCPPTSSTNSVTYVAYFPSDGRRVDLVDFCGSRNNEWTEDLWTIPAVTNTGFWSTDQGFWLYADVFQKSNVYDTVTWEILFIRARLID